MEAETRHDGRKGLLEASRLAVRYLDERDGERVRPNPVRELLAAAVAEEEAAGEAKKRATEPWQIERTETDQSMIYQQVSGTHCVRVVGYVNHPDGDPEGVANGLLMVSAPEMRKTLAWVLEELGKPREEQAPMICEAIEAVLAKAE